MDSVVTHKPKSAINTTDDTEEATSELEIPEVFTLQPLSSQRATVRVRKIEPARFYFVDEDIDVEDIED